MKTMKIVYILGVLVWAVGCMDLGVEPENSVTFENFFNTEKDIELTYDAMRNEFRNVSFDGGRRPVTLGYVHDEANSSTQKDFDWAIGNFTPMWSEFDWGGYYRVVCMANIVLENVGRVKMEQKRVDYYIGQAHFHRAFSYFRIAQIWGEAPLQTNSRDVVKKAKVSHQTLLQFALDEVNIAIKLLPRQQELTNSSGQKIERKSQGCQEVAKALKLEICLWKAAMCNETALLDEAIRAANYVIDSSDYVLAATPEEVCAKVLPGGSTEGVFEIKFDASESRITQNPWTTMNDLATFPVKPEAGRGAVKTAKARMFWMTVDKMYPGMFEGAIKDGKYTGDKRRLAYFYDLDTIGRNPEWKNLAGGYAYPYKFRKIKLSTDSWNMGAFDCFACDHVIWRLTDIILLRAEAYARKGQNDLAAKDLNRIRERAFGDKSHDYTAAEGDLRHVIFKEREKELIWEGKRWWDVLRNGYWKTELWEFHKTEMTQVDVDNGALFMPVGQSAFKENSLMFQNRYWQSRY